MKYKDLDSINPTIYYFSFNKFLVDKMEDIFIVSSAKLASSNSQIPNEIFQSEETQGLAIQIDLAKGKKCEMSWKISEDVGADPNYPDLSARCARIVSTYNS